MLLAECGPHLLALAQDNASDEAFVGKHSLTDEGLAEVLAELPQLKALDLCNCDRLTDACLQGIAKLPSLERLALPKDANLTTEGLRCFEGAQLEFLNNNQFLRNRENSDPDRFGIWLRAHKDPSRLHNDDKAGFWNLAALSDKDGDRWIRQLVGVKGVRKLILISNGTTDAGLKMLQELPELQWLCIGLNGDLTQNGLAEVGKCKSLTILELRLTHEYTPAFIKNITAEWLKPFATGRLEEFVIPPFLDTEETVGVYLDALTPAARRSQFHNFGKPTTDRLSRDLTWPATPRALKALQGRDGIRAVSIDVKDKIDDAAIKELWSLPDLTQVVFRGDGVASGAFSGCENAKKLKLIRIIGGKQLTDHFLECIAKSKSLEALEVTAAEGVTDRGILLLQSCTELRRLSLSELKGVGPLVEIKLKKALPSCEILLRE